MRRNPAHGCAPTMMRRADSTYVRAAHLHQGCFNAPPGLGLLLVALLLESGGFLRGFRDCLEAVRLEQATRIVLDVRCLHGFMLPFRLSTLRRSPGSGISDAKLDGFHAHCAPAFVSRRTGCPRQARA